MPVVHWPLVGGRPVMEIALPQLQRSGRTRRTLLADTGGGTLNSVFELVLADTDCRSCGGTLSHFVHLRGSYQGRFPLYWLRIQISALGFDQRIPVIGVSTSIPHLDGIACFRFLNRFTYGNFGRFDQFGLEN